MTLPLNEKGYGEWLAQRAQLTPQEAFLYDTLADEYAATPPNSDQPAITKKRQPPTYIEWYTARGKLSEKNTETLDNAAQALIDKRKQQKTPPTKKTAPGIIQIAEQPTPKTNEYVATINLAGPGGQTIVPAKHGFTHFVKAIVFSATAETDILISFGSSGSSGAMHFDPAAGPAAIQINAGDSPIPAGPGPVTISSSGPTAAVKGYIHYAQYKD